MDNHAEKWPPAMDMPVPGKPRFPVTACSQCGAEFGPGEHGYSHCNSHRARKFVSIGPVIMYGNQCVAVAKSKTFGKRIARALNLHIPNGEGV